MTSGLWSWIRRRRLRLAIGAAVVLVLVGLFVLWLPRAHWGTPAERVVSPTGAYEVVQYEWTAMIDPGWNLAIERVDGDGREWFWRSVEGPAPKAIRFTGPTSVEVTDADGEVYRVDFDPASLEPSDRFCLSPSYCSDAPWDSYTRDAP